LLFAFPAAGQRVILHVDGQVPATPFAMANTDTILGVLGLEQWPAQDQETTHEAIRAFAEFREAMYEQGDMAKARSAFENGYRIIKSLSSVSTGTDLILEGLWLGVHLELIEGRIESAKRVALTALRVDPSRQPPAIDYSPRVRKMLQATSQSLRRLTITGLPIGCDVFVLGAGSAQRLLPGKYVVGLACNGEAQPWVGRTILWDGQSSVDVKDLGLWNKQGHLAVHGSSALKIAERLLGKTGTEEVVIVRTEISQTWSAVRLTREARSQAPTGLSEDGLRRWVLVEPTLVLPPEASRLHTGTWWGIGLTSTGVALLAGALGTRAAANSAIGTVNQGIENRLEQAERFQAATWALLGSGSVLSVIGVVLALNYGLRDTGQPLESSVQIEPSLNGAVVRF
jgi:hypothetical protein